MKKSILALAVMVAVGLAGCAEKTAIDISSTVPAAEAELRRARTTTATLSWISR